MKNYIGFGNDHSGSMNGLTQAALRDFNTTSGAIKDAATREMLDTIVSVVGFGVGGGYGIKREIVNSNPHVLKPMTSWAASGGTPLYDAVGDLIELFESMPDYSNPDVSFLLMITTDGGENGSRKYNETTLRRKIETLNKDGRWTIVFRVPKGYANTMTRLGIPAGNIQEWDTTTAGMAASTVATTAAVDAFYSSRASGARSSGTFYASAADVSVKDVKAVLEDISAKVSTWPVLKTQDGEEIRPFAEQRLGTTPYLKGAAFYQLTKTERAIQEDKLIIIRDKRTKLMYFGPAARGLIGLPLKGSARVKPGEASKFDIFVQSKSINRKLVAGTSVVYWPAVGEGFTEADFPWLKPGYNPTPAQQAAATSAIAATAAVAPKASKSAPVAKGVKFYPTRAEARKHGKAHDAGEFAPAGQRWFVIP